VLQINSYSIIGSKQQFKNYALMSYLDDSTFASQNEVLGSVMPFSGACWCEKQICLSGVMSEEDEVGEVGDIYML